MTDSRQPGFWQTLPGVLTALAGVITAVAGLIVAFNQIHNASARTPAADQAPTAVPATGDSRSSAASRLPSGSRSSVREAAPPGVVPLTVGPPGEVRFKEGTLVYSVLAAQLEPFNPDTQLLAVRLRINNGMKVFDRNYYSELRAVADGLPQAPVDPSLEQIEAHSVKDLTYTFRLPGPVRSLALRITRDEQAADIPLRLQ